MVNAGSNTASYYVTFITSHLLQLKLLIKYWLSRMCCSHQHFNYLGDKYPLLVTCIHTLCSIIANPPCAFPRPFRRNRLRITAFNRNNTTVMWKRGLPRLTHLTLSMGRARSTHYDIHTHMHINTIIKDMSSVLLLIQSSLCEHNFCYSRYGDSSLSATMQGILAYSLPKRKGFHNSLF